MKRCSSPIFREVQNKITMRYCYHQKAENIKCWQGYGEIRSFVHCIADGNKNSAASMENIVAVPQKVKNRITM